MTNQNLSPHQFMSTFKPSEYGETWDEVPHSEDFGHDDVDVAGGIHTPVGVHQGYVVDGHHRVVAAAREGVEVPYEHFPSWLYEGQEPR